MKKNISQMKIFRLVMQVVFLIFMPGLFTMCYSELKEIYVSIINSNFNLLNNITQYIELVMIVSVTILFGRFFCGWICAFGTFNDLIYMVFNRIFKTRLIINGKLDTTLKHLKYLVLLFIIAAVWTGKSKLFVAINPWDAFAQIPELLQAVSENGMGFAVLGFIIIGAMFIERFFCRYLYPLGAVFSVISKINLLSINKPKTECGNCRICTSKCSMGIKLYEKDKINGGECIGCLRCTEGCPRENIRVGNTKETFSPMFVSSIIIIIFLGVSFISGSVLGGNTAKAASITNNTGQKPDDGTSNRYDDSYRRNFSTGEDPSDYQQGKDYPFGRDHSFDGSNNLSDNNDYSQGRSSGTGDSSSSLQSNQYKDGTYTGVGRGYRPNLQVSVTVKNNKITDIEIISDNETPRYTVRPFNIVPKEIIDSQSSDVDTVAGATKTSNGIMAAVENALSKAQVN